MTIRNFVFYQKLLWDLRNLRNYQLRLYIYIYIQKLCNFLLYAAAATAAAFICHLLFGQLIVLRIASIGIVTDIYIYLIIILTPCDNNIKYKMNAQLPLISFK